MGFELDVMCRNMVESFVRETDSYAALYRLIAEEKYSEAKGMLRRELLSS